MHEKGRSGNILNHGSDSEVYLRAGRGARVQKSKLTKTMT